MSTQVLDHQLKKILSYLNDPKVHDVIANSNGSIWVQRAGSSLTQVGVMEPDEIERIICTVASLAGKELKNLGAILECEIPHYGHRFEGLLPPVVPRPAFAIRCRATFIYPLESYLERCAISKAQYGALKDGLKARKNILVVGGTGTGKTTFINALLSEFEGSSERFLICEDTPELHLPNTVSQSLLTSQEKSFNDLIRATLRLRPDRIIIGELRGKEALELLKSMNTGHPGGIASIHANSCEAALLRINDLCGEATHRDCRALIGETIDLVVYLERSVSGPIVLDLISVQGFDPSSQTFKFQTCSHNLETLSL